MVGRRNEQAASASRALRPGVVALLLIALLSAAIFLPLRRADYVQDDHLAVETNVIVERGDWGEIFSTSYWEGAAGEDRSLYRPLPILSYALERRLSGRPDPRLSHLINVLLHALTAWLVFRLTLRVGAGSTAAVAAGALFATHPVHVEAVANVVGRAEILGTLFSTLAFLLLIRSGEWPRAPSGRDTPSPALARLASWAAALCVFLALGSKEIFVVTPLLMVALEWLLRPRESVRRTAWWIDRAAALAPSALAAGLYIALRVRALEMLVSVQRPHPADNLLVDLGGAERLATALALVPRYAGLLFYPAGLSADYSGPAIPAEASLLGVRPLLGTLLLLLLAASGSLALWRRRRFGAPVGLQARTGFAVGLILLPYLVVGNLFVNIGTVFAERLMYYPSVGFCLLAGLLLGTAPSVLPTFEDWPPIQRRRLVLAILGILLAAYSLRSWSRSLDWRDDETVFTAAARVQPRSARSHFILGKLQAQRGETERALESWDATLERYPAWVMAWFEKGVAYGEQGRYEQAAAMFGEAARLNPSYAAAQLNHGIALRRLGRRDEAERALRRATLWDPDSARAWAECGNLWLEAGRPEDAARAYRRAIALGRGDLGERLRRAERLAAGLR